MEKASGLSFYAIAVALGITSPDTLALFVACAAASIGGLLLSLELGWRRNLKVLFGSFFVGSTITLVGINSFPDHLWGGPMASALVSYSPQVLDRVIQLLNKKAGG